MADPEADARSGQQENHLREDSNEAPDEAVDANMDNQDHTASALAPAHKVASQTASGNLLARLPIVKSKGNKDTTTQDRDRRRKTEKLESKAQKEAESRERKTRQDHERNEREEKRKAGKEVARQNKEDMTEKKAEEKRFKTLYRIRGFDPNAGREPQPPKGVADRQSLSLLTSRVGVWSLGSWSITVARVISQDIIKIAVSVMGADPPLDESDP